MVVHDVVILVFVYLKCLYYLRQVPLVTPEVLSQKKLSLTKVRNQISQTMNAFKRAERQGFRLEDVGNAPLAKRRKLKRSMSRSSSSSDSSRSSYSYGSLTPTKHLGMSPMRNSPVRNLSNTSTTSQNSNASLGFTPLKKCPTSSSTASAHNSDNPGIFSFREARIAALTPTITSSLVTSSLTSSSDSTAKTDTTSGLLKPKPSLAAVHGEGASSSQGSSRTEKRDYSVQEILDSDDDDDDADCMIVCEEQGFVLKSTHCSDAANNNSSSSASSTPTRPRSDTIVIE